MAKTKVSYGVINPHTFLIYTAGMLSSSIIIEWHFVEHPVYDMLLLQLYIDKLSLSWWEAWEQSILKGKAYKIQSIDLPRIQAVLLCGWYSWKVYT